MSLRMKKIGALAAAATLSLSITACSQSKDSGTTSSDSTASAASLPGTAWVRADASQVKQGGTLRLSITQMPDNWNSQQTDGAQVDLTTVRSAEGSANSLGFLTVDEKGVAKVNPDYIESATLKSTDPQVVEVKFNKKAVWQDGTPITIKDLINYVHALSGKDKAFQVASTQGWEDIASVKQTADEYTGEVTFAKKNADWIQYIYPDLPSSITTNAAKFNSGYVNTPTPSAGPYMIGKVDTTAKVITEVPNPKWWGNKPKLDQIIFKVVSQPQTPSSFANKELDAIDVPNGDVYDTATKRDDAQLLTSGGTQWTHLTLNTTHGALADPAVRKAVALGINRDVVAQAVIGPLHAPVSLMNNAVFMPGQQGYKDSYNGELKFDAAKAEQTLKDAGYTKDGNVYAKDGKKLSFTVIVPDGSKTNSDRAAQIQKNLNSIGFDIKIQTVPSDQYFKSFINKKNFDMVTFTWQGATFPISSAANIFYPVSSNQNYTGYSNPKVADLNAKAQNELDPAKRIDIADQMSEAMLSDYTVIPFYAVPNVMAVRKDIVNYGPSQLEGVDWTKVGFKA